MLKVQAQLAKGSEPETVACCCVTRFIGGSLHDLASPVNRIGTVAEPVLKSYGRLDSKREDLSSHLQNSASQLQILMSWLRTYLRIAGANGDYAAPDFHVSAFVDERKWVISVTDSGIEIDPRYADLVFGMLRRIHGDADSGNGVGLAIEWQTVDRQRRLIRLESEPGRGSRFSSMLAKAA